MKTNVPITTMGRRNTNVKTNAKRISVAKKKKPKVKMTNVAKAMKKNTKVVLKVKRLDLLLLFKITVIKSE